ncbi:MAG: hypothetical protein AVDCRST_MAG64-2039, partial [uncultured Phycisphaerae bacterium]
VAPRRADHGHRPRGGSLGRPHVLRPPPRLQRLHDRRRRPPGAVRRRHGLPGRLQGRRPRRPRDPRHRRLRPVRPGPRHPRAGVGHGRPRPRRAHPPDAPQHLPPQPRTGTRAGRAAHGCRGPGRVSHRCPRGRRDVGARRM